MVGEAQPGDGIEASSAAALADLEAQFGSGVTPEDSGEAAIRARFRNRPAPATPERRKNPWEKLIELRDRVNQTQLPFLPRRAPHTTEPAPAAPEPALTPERRRWYQGLGSMFWGMAVNWGKNLDFRGKDEAWVIGMGMGAGIGVASNFLVAPGVDRLILSGTRFAASQSVYAVTKGAYALEKSRLNRQVTGEDLSRRLEEIEKRRSRALKLIGNFMLGMSAGTTYTSLTGATLGAAEHFLGARLPDINVGSIAEKVVNKVKEAKLPEVGMPEVKLEMPDVGAGVRGVIDKIGSTIQEAETGGEPLVQTREALETLTQTKEYQDSIAAVVGNRLDLTDQVVNEAIKNMVDPTKVSKQAFEHARYMVQHEMERQANISFNPANYNFDFSGKPISWMKEGFAQNFDSNISDPNVTRYLQDIALGDLKESFVSEMVSSDPFKQSVAAAVGAHLDTVTNNTVNEVLAARGLDPSKLSPEALQKIHDALRHQMENYANFQFGDAAETAVGRGILDTQVVATEGNKLFADFLNIQQVHDQLVKTATEALGQPQVLSFDLSSLDSSNVVEKIIPGNTTVGHMLFEAGVQTGWGADQAQLFGAEIAANHELLSAAWAANEHTPFPIEIGGNLQSLIERAQNGDAAALQKLKDALRWIPEGARFKILSKAGVNAVLAAIPK